VSRCEGKVQVIDSRETDLGRVISNRSSVDSLA